MIFSDWEDFFLLLQNYTISESGLVRWSLADSFIELLHQKGSSKCIVWLPYTKPTQPTQLCTSCLIMLELILIILLALVVLQPTKKTSGQTAVAPVPVLSTLLAPFLLPALPIITPFTRPFPPAGITAPAVQAPGCTGWCFWVFTVMDIQGFGLHITRVSSYLFHHLLLRWLKLWLCSRGWYNIISSLELCGKPDCICFEASTEPTCWEIWWWLWCTGWYKGDQQLQTGVCCTTRNKGSAPLATVCIIEWACWLRHGHATTDITRL